MVKTNNKVAPRVLFNYDIDKTIEEDPLDFDDADSERCGDQSTSEIEMIIDDVDDQEQMAVEPEVIKQDIIFDTEETKAPPKLTKNGKVRKPMSQEHKEKLKIAREKGAVVRKQKQLEREEERSFANEEKELLKKKKKKDFEKLKMEVEEPIESNDKEQATTNKVKNNQKTFTQKDLEDASLDAIIKYETIRKERKKKKQEEQLIKNQREEIKNKLQNNQPIQRKYRDGSNRYDFCY